MDKQNAIDHNHMNLADKVALIGELEHAYRHLLKAATVVQTDVAFWYLVTAARVQQARRRLQHTLGEVATEDWCLLKVGASITQLAEETFDGDGELLHELVGIGDELAGHALGVDLSGCKSCDIDKASD